MARRSQEPASEQRLGEITHLSYSGMDKWFNCPKALELAKIRKAPQVPAWWFAGGSAVHSATEEYDRWTLREPTERGKFSIRDEFEKAFAAEVHDIDQREPDRTRWRHAGPKTAPETYGQWMKQGPLLVGNYITWRRTTDYIVWRHRDEGQEVLGIETDLSTRLPYCNREIKAYADRIFYSPGLSQLHIIDLKTGTRGPKNALQFGVYGACLAFKYEDVATTGAAFMNREGKLGKAFSLAKYTPEYVGRMFGHLARAIDAQIFPAHLGSSCRMCDVSDACYANDGEHAAEYDPDHPDCPPF